MRLGLLLAALAGLGLATGLVAAIGWADVGHALGVAGWPGLAALCAAHLGYWAVCGAAWRVLLPGDGRLLGLIGARWVRDAGSDLLPVSSLGGDLMGARVAVLGRLTPAAALASTVVDVTLEVTAQLGFTLLGLALLVASAHGAALAGPTLVGLAIATPLLLGFMVAQRIGLFVLLERFGARLAQRWRWSALAGADGLHDAIIRLYRARGRLAANGALHLVGWVASAAEAWLALLLLGAAPGIVAVLVIESLAAALRSAAFVVPGAIGVQEGGYVVLGALFGLGPETMLALSLLKRARDLALGVPALLAWQWIEARRWRRAA
jgi:putative membrane protein